VNKLIFSPKTPVFRKIQLNFAKNQAKTQKLAQNRKSDFLSIFILISPLLI